MGLDGIYKGEFILHQELLYFCFVSAFQHELNEFQTTWNTKHVRRSAEAPGGKPDILFSLPETVGFTKQGLVIEESDLKAAADVLSIHHQPVNRNDDIHEMLTNYCRSNGLSHREMLTMELIYTQSFFNSCLTFIVIVHEIFFNYLFAHKYTNVYNYTIFLNNSHLMQSFTATTRQRVRQVVQKQHSSSLSQQQHALHQDQLAPYGGLTVPIGEPVVTRPRGNIPERIYPLPPQASMVFKQFPSSQIPSHGLGEPVAFQTLANGVAL